MGLTSNVCFMQMYEKRMLNLLLCISQQSFQIFIDPAKVLSMFMLLFILVKVCGLFEFKRICTGFCYYTSLPEGGGGYTVLPLSVCLSFRPSKIFFVAFFVYTCICIAVRDYQEGFRIGILSTGLINWTHFVSVPHQDLDVHQFMSQSFYVQ